MFIRTYVDFAEQISSFFVFSFKNPLSGRKMRKNRRYISQDLINFLVFFLHYVSKFLA